MIGNFYMEAGTMDWSTNLSSWAYQKGYSLLGRCGTYDDLELWKSLDLIRRFPWNKIPNIIEMESIIRGMEE